MAIWENACCSRHQTGIFPAHLDLIKYYCNVADNWIITIFTLTLIPRSLLPTLLIQHLETVIIETKFCF